MPNVGLHNNTGKGPYQTWSDANWKGGFAVADGDLVYQDPNDTNATTGQPYDKTAANLAWGGSLSATQVTFKGYFKGVSTVRRTTLQTTDGSMLTDGPILATGEFMFPCAALGSNQNVGSYVGVAQGVGNTIDGTHVAIVSSVSNAIGKTTQYAAAGATFLVFEIFPFLFNSGTQAQA